MKNLISYTLFLCLVLPVMSAHAVEEKSASIDLYELLELVKAGRVTETIEHREREARFKLDADEQKELYKSTLKLRLLEEELSETLERRYTNQTEEIANLEDRLNERMGELKELFGHLQTNAGKAEGRFKGSVLSSQYPDRSQAMGDLAKKIGDSSQLPTIEEIRRLWFELQREMTESSSVIKFPSVVVGSDGLSYQEEIVRIGSFNLVAGNDYLQFLPEQQEVAELARQPESRFRNTAGNLAKADILSEESFMPFAIDPTRGALLSLLKEKPTLGERINQGGLVGYIIIVVGIVGFIIGLYRLIYLLLINRKVQAQIKSRQANEQNPLGRILAVYGNNQFTDPETLEMKLSEAILKEKPALEQFHTLLKVIFVAAPLMGLLGTVTGMINTFQAITLFGTGDPKLMAGGISQALVTTVLGLCVAIPTLLLHTIVTSRSKTLIQILTERSTGLVAERISNSIRAEAIPQVTNNERKIENPTKEAEVC